MAFNKEDVVDDKTRHADTATTVPQADVEHASAASAPSDISQQALDQASPGHSSQPSSHLQSGTTARLDEATTNASPAALKPQDPEIPRAVATPLEMHRLGIDAKLG